MWREFSGYLQSRRGLGDFQAVPREQRRIAFYSEGKGYWTHLQPILDSLHKVHETVVHYLTSDPDDPVLGSPPPGVRAFFVGKGLHRTLLFATLDVDIMVMTMPDLHTYHIKRSPNPVHYVYVHHSIVSTHMIYRERAFDHFDSVFCVGPHHEKEIRAREEALGLPAKHLFPHGYGRLDQLLCSAPGNRTAARNAHTPCAIVAPSWGPEGLLEQHGPDVVRPLLASGFEVIVRPHPRTRTLRPALEDELRSAFGDDGRFRLDSNMDAWTSLEKADVMISDWSGAALEFALALEKPVVYVDVPRKVNNPNYRSLDLEPIEVTLRPRLGAILPQSELGQLGSMALQVLREPGEFRDRARTERSAWIFNVGHSGAAAAQELCRILEERHARDAP